jgi:hypothetical protein
VVRCKALGLACPIDPREWQAKDRAEQAEREAAREEERLQATWRYWLEKAASAASDEERDDAWKQFDARLPKATFTRADVIAYARECWVEELRQSLEDFEPDWEP